MKSLLPLTMVCSLLASAAPANAQEQIGTLALAITQKARLLAADPESSAREENVSPTSSARSQDPNWSRVRRLEPGTSVMIAVRGSQPGPRYLAGADESGVTTVNPMAQELSGDAARLVREIVSNHPDYFVSVATTGRTFRQGKLTVSADGVFMAGRKVADLNRIVERVDRNDIDEMTVRTERTVLRRVAIGAGAIGGFIGGGLAGCHFSFFKNDAQHTNCFTGSGSSLGDPRPMIGAYLGGIAGGFSGAFLMRQAFSRTRQDVVYHGR